MAVLSDLSFYLCLFSSAILAHYIPISRALDRPVHLVVLALTVCSFVLPSVVRALPQAWHPPETRQDRAQYAPLPLEDYGSADGRATEPARKAQSQGKVRISVLVLAVVALSTRIELYRQINKSQACAMTNVEMFLPALLAIYDAIRSQRQLEPQYEDKPDSSIYENLVTTIQTYLLRPRYRYILSVTLVCFGGYLTQGLWASSRSTYVCAIARGGSRRVPLMQMACLVLDFCLAIIAYESSPKSDGRGLPPRRCVVLWSSVMISTAVVWYIVAVVLYIFKPETRSWLLFFYPTLELGTIIAMVALVFTFCALSVTTLHGIMKYGVLDMSIYLTAALSIIPATEFLWTHRNPFPPFRTSATTTAFTMVLAGCWAYRRVQQAMGNAAPIRLYRSFILFALFCTCLYPAWKKRAYIHYHPITLLMYDAKLHHDNYVQTLGHTFSLAETVGRYKQRYNRNPPPGFDVWFDFAKNRSVWVVDEFDQIDQDLLPFRAIPPADLRQQTWEMVSNPWNEISGITIRGGEAKVQDNVIPTHRWMLEGVAVLINSFAKHLPDMDLAFNLNDESRVNVPHDHLVYLREQARASNRNGSAGWSNDRAAGWPAIPEQAYTETVFRENSWRNSFHDFGSIGCPPSSLARSSPHVTAQSHLCIECVVPHSLGQFVGNWTDAADVCHQPDLAHLHGFYLSPAAFKASFMLRPVFSQSKPHGYNDILYPSAWNYMDKVVYRPTEPSGTPGKDDYSAGFPERPFAEKENTLFWRGATSEGVSSESGAWRGMTRQRLVHMANNLTSHPHDQVTILLPNPEIHSKFKYQTLPGTAVKELGLNTDIAVVDFIARCGGKDCDDQKAEFNLVGPSDFQAHWRYKFLFDLDGAGFSGRFLPFLQSHSLPFKTALFREWYDSRITAWLHFVPQDIRLHGLWSTLAYFAGVNGTMFGQNIWWKPHEKEAEFIADAGREWANKVLRKEDMECYFFRLLLEWGRITDDNRDELGFVL